MGRVARMNMAAIVYVAVRWFMLKDIMMHLKLQFMKIMFQDIFLIYK